ncbi:MAG: M24 family metallopeptidase [Candidatus Aenigmarchaeota archaeon]|nr:M24 family metallopeptidase [Candidatus Aenigmarchaeota archaeon]
MIISKTKKEVKLIEKAAEISNSCLKLVEESLKEKITEKELRRRIERKIRSQNATLSFRTIVACGKRSAKIHPKPRATNRIIKGIGYVDFGACYKGYKTDVTVPFIKGEISKRERKIVETTLEAYKIAISSIKVGMPCWKLFEKVDCFLRKNGFRMLHPLGHGLGLKTHDKPSISGKPKKKKLLKRWKEIRFQENMVFAIEPAIYVKGLGGCRLENDVLLTKKGIKILTNSRLIEV